LVNSQMLDELQHNTFVFVIHTAWFPCAWWITGRDDFVPWSSTPGHVDLVVDCSGMQPVTVAIRFSGCKPWTSIPPRSSTTSIARVCIQLGGVAQLARAFGSYPKGRGFDPLRRYHYLHTHGGLAQLGEH